MTPQDLKEQLIKTEAYTIGYRNGSADVIKWVAERLDAELKAKNKPETGTDQGTPDNN